VLFSITGNLPKWPEIDGSFGQNPGNSCLIGHSLRKTA
jgi:hypothetical protein